MTDDADMQLWPGRVLAAARALAGLSIEALAGRSGVSVNTIRRIEAAPVVEVTGKQSRAERIESVYRVSDGVWHKVIDTFYALGVELVPPGTDHGAGARLKLNGELRGGGDDEGSKSA